MKIIYDAVVFAPFGKVGIRVSDGLLTGVDFLSKDVSAQKPSSELSKDVARQIEQYFYQADFRFDVPCAFAGTEFQRRVWSEIRKIDCGKTLSYGDVAKKIKSAPRAVGGACGANPYPLITPCHRVIAADGGLGGFSGCSKRDFLLGVKRWLLAHEGVLL